MRVRHVVVEVDDLNGQKVNVGLDAIAGTQVPVSQVNRNHVGLRVIAVETDAGSEVDRITGEVVEKVGKILDGAAPDHVQAARDLLAPPSLRRESLVAAAAQILHAIHDIDRTGPVEVRRDDLRAALEALEFATPFVEAEDAALRRLRDALEGR